jgi:predicted ABC-type ATPase
MASGSIRRVGYVPEVSDDRVVVCGPPGAGKTTYVESQRRPGDLVFDLDVLAAAMFQQPKHPRPDDAVALLSAMREAVISYVRRFGFAGRVYVIVASVGHARAVARDLGARVKEMKPLDAT